MNLSMKRDGDKLTIAVEGKVDAMTAPKFENEIIANIKGVSELIIDLAQTEYLSSAGLRTVLYAQKLMNEQGSMRVLNVSQEVMDIFVVTGFAQILTFE